PRAAPAGDAGGRRGRGGDRGGPDARGGPLVPRLPTGRVAHGARGGDGALGPQALGARASAAGRAVGGPGYRRGMTIEPRAARPGEYDAIGAIVAAAFAADGQLDSPGSASYGTVLRDVAGRAAHAQVVAALDDGTVVGGVTYVPDGGPMADLARDGEAEIRML